MARRAEFKVCGLTRLEDAQAAVAAGASFLGFIFYEKSPRKTDLVWFASVRDQLPSVAKVAVTVSPDARGIQEFLDAGFDYVQIHFAAKDRAKVPAWSEQVGAARLWLAPKMDPRAGFDESLLEFADTILWDGFKKDANTYGGTGAVSDWDGFRAARLKFPQKRWILAGGLGPANLRDALAATGAPVLDFNSGLETSPGVKDLERIREVPVLLGAE